MSTTRNTKTKANHAKIQINGYITKAAESGDINVLLKTIASHLDDMNDINLATSMHRVGKLVTRKETKSPDKVIAHPVFEQLYKLVRSRIVDHPKRAGSGEAKSKIKVFMPLQCMSVIAWSYSVMKLHDEEVLAAIAELAAPRLHEFQPFEIAQLLWAFAKLGLPQPELFGAASRRLLHREAGEFKGLCLSMIAWSFSAVEVHDLRLFRSLAEELPVYASDLRPQELSTTLKAFAEVGLFDEKLFTAFGSSAAMQEKVQTFTAQELADILLAFAKAGRLHETLFAHAGPVIIQKRWLMTAHNISTLFWVFATLQVPNCQPMLTALLEAFIFIGKSATVDDVSRVLTASVRLRRLCLCTADLLMYIAQTREHKTLEGALVALPTDDLLLVASAWSKLELPPPANFDILVRESVRRCPSLDVTELTAMLECALEASCQPGLAPCMGTSWVAASTRALAPLLDKAPAGDVEKVRSMLSNFEGSPSITEASKLQDFLPHFVKQSKFASNATTKFDSDATTKFDNNATTVSVSFRLFESSEESTSEDGLWESIRKQSAAKAKTGDKARNTGTSWTSAQGQHTKSEEVPTPHRSLSEVLEGQRLGWADVVRIAQRLLFEVDACTSVHGMGAVRSVGCSSITLDDNLHPHLTFKDAGVDWWSPEEEHGSIDTVGKWPQLSFRLGLLIRCMLLTGSSDPYDDSSCERTRSCPELVKELINSCLRLGAHEGVPTRPVVEASLAVMVMQSDLVTAHCSRARS
eukprot:CAMPEP_0177166426 /NCGR_PEP_ID=MMETSP0367-20130122/8023_1 /TAXON_ID=447022 ORGANISM="Scrippsiella hangoei-like, Strain SHHI-4" /NCGR_SAMPLE_ID=MMETSP0367 /ASSEMBLY_ACC=CAM_ASM_000362 /LENGTH=751 /DNA_ID=CAMNT_0018612485 /DNA_START=47 /DNA_END=2302 /DNA_ORIENTATION=-